MSDIFARRKKKGGKRGKVVDYLAEMRMDRLLHPEKHQKKVEKERKKEPVFPESDFCIMGRGVWPSVPKKRF